MTTLKDRPFARTDENPHPRDRRLQLALRTMGFLVVLGSMFFLMKSITLDPVVNGFFGVSAGLGFLILVAGWIPSKEPAATRITPGTTTTYRRSSRSDRPTGQPAFQPVFERKH